MSPSTLTPPPTSALGSPAIKTTSRSGSRSGEDPKLVELRARVAALREELGPDQDANAIVARHIKLLHTYNETKDTSQMLIAIYAQMTQKTITQMHTELGLSLSE